MIERIGEAPVRVFKKKAKLPRIAFAGIESIDPYFIKAVVQNGLAEIVAVANRHNAPSCLLKEAPPEARVVNCVDDLLGLGLDGLLIGGPHGLDVKQAVAFIHEGASLFYTQFPTANAEQTHRLLKAAQTCNRLLAADFSYRTLTGVNRLRSLLRQGELGRLFGAEFVFHTTKPTEPLNRAARAGCLLSQGIPLLDLLLWCLDFPSIKEVSSRLCAGGKPLPLPSCQPEDFASARLLLETGTSVQLSCSWNLPAGCEAIITGSFYGTRGGAEFRNINGSRKHFTTTQWQGNRRESIPATSVSRAESSALHWVRQLAQSPCYAPEIEHIIPLASALDQIYGR